MKLKSAFIITGLFFVNTYSSIGWQTTRNGYCSGSCQIQSNKLRVIVHPFFAEVEEKLKLLLRVVSGPEMIKHLRSLMNLIYPNQQQYDQCCYGTEIRF
jgi:hypothetical protein